MITCFVCHRKLIRCAVPGLQIGPVCARNRGYLLEPDVRPAAATRAGVVSHISRGRRSDAQLDWINELASGHAVV